MKDMYEQIMEKVSELNDTDKQWFETTLNKLEATILENGDVGIMALVTLCTKYKV